MQSQSSTIPTPQGTPALLRRQHYVARDQVSPRRALGRDPAMATIGTTMANSGER